MTRTFVLVLLLLDMGLYEYGVSSTKCFLKVVGHLNCVPVNADVNSIISFEGLE